MIIGAFFIYAQNQYLRNYNVGFVRDQIAILGTGFRCMQHKDVYVNKLKESPEIGIRKVHGAMIGSILWMFNRHYLAILAACFVVAAPFAWYAVQEWLQGFAYKTPMHWWIYALTFLIVTSITFATVTYQCWRTAVKNPTDSIRTE